VYRAYDELGYHDNYLVDITGLPTLTNKLEPAARHVEPRLLEFREAVETAAGWRPLLAGSGSSYFVVYFGEAEADAARARVADAVDGQVVVGHTVDSGVRVRG